MKYQSPFPQEVIEEESLRDLETDGSWVAGINTVCVLIY